MRRTNTNKEKNINTNANIEYNHISDSRNALT